METNVQKLVYEDGNFKKLTADFKTLSTFSGIATWDSQAQSEIETITRVIQNLTVEISTQTRALDAIKQEKSEKSFVGRLFSGNKAQTEVEKLMGTYEHYKTVLEKMVNQLQESIDFTPNSPDEQKILIKELKQRKKELQMEKKEVAAAMKAVRTDARQQSAKAGMALGGLFYNSKAAASQRRGIRYQKEAILRPHEDAKTAIDRQIVQVDRDILWAEKFRE